MEVNTEPRNQSAANRFATTGCSQSICNGPRIPLGDVAACGSAWEKPSKSLEDFTIKLSGVNICIDSQEQFSAPALAPKGHFPRPAHSSR